MTRARRLVASCLLLAACSANSRPVVLSPPPAIGERDLLEFEYHGKDIAMRAVRFTANSVSGTDWRYPDAPRLSFPLAELSNARLSPANELQPQPGKALFYIFAGFLGLVLFLKTLCGDACGPGS